MACNCLETTKEKILAKLTEIHPDYTISDADYENRIWALGSLGDGDINEYSGVILTHRFGYNYTFKKVNGEDSKPRNTNININPTYCGFCGKKFVESE